MKIMIYSQHVLGIGHFFRSMEIARALAGHQVLFVEGGDPVEGLTPPDHVQRVFLPPLMMDADFTRIEVHGGEIGDIKRRRAEILMDTTLRFAPDIFVTELFPFGRKHFRFELMPVLEQISQSAGPTRVVCSLRDILVEKKNQIEYERGVLSTLNRHYHLLLVHSDPELFRLEDTFASAGEIRIPIDYTGFVVRKPPLSPKPSPHKTVVASSGGGKVGVDLLASTVGAFLGIPRKDARLRVFLGPFMEQEDRERLERLAAPDARISLHPFSLDFLSELAEADLSISMAGYNTCMDILSVGVKALVHPFTQNREQAMRAAKLEELGVLKVLGSLDESELREGIMEALEGANTTPTRLPNVDGARTTARILEDLSGSGRSSASRDDPS